MPNRNQTRNSDENEEQQQGGGWLLAGAVGAILGAGAAYFLTKNQPTQPSGCGASRNTSSNQDANFDAAPKGCCSICRGDYDATITMSCGHILHKDCYEQMRLHAGNRPVLCPLCRKTVG